METVEELNDELEDAPKEASQDIPKDEPKDVPKEEEKEEIKVKKVYNQSILMLLIKNRLKVIVECKHFVDMINICINLKK